MLRRSSDGAAAAAEDDEDDGAAAGGGASGTPPAGTPSLRRVGSNLQPLILVCGGVSTEVPSGNFFLVPCWHRSQAQ